MVPRLPVREGRGLCGYGGGAGVECRVWGDDHRLSGLQSLAEGDICCC